MGLARRFLASTPGRCPGGFSALRKRPAASLENGKNKKAGTVSVSGREGMESDSERTEGGREGPNVRLADANP